MLNRVQGNIPLPKNTHLYIYIYMQWQAEDGYHRATLLRSTKIKLTCIKMFFRKKIYFYK